jgi:indolepyruvate ferredoxin oxidoreductase, alpha subunit
MTMDILTTQPKTTLLLQGNEAIARGALEAGVRWAGGYPGNPSSEIIETLAGISERSSMYVEWSVNEKVALESAAAASLAGIRALATMKQNGVNVCLDSLTTISLAGINAGLLLVTADDPSGISSSNEEDSRFAAQLAHIPLLEPSTPQEALEMTRFAFNLSEDIRNICLLRTVSRVSHTRSGVSVGPMRAGTSHARFDTSSAYHTFPITTKHQAQYDKLALAAVVFEKAPFNKHEGPCESDLLIIAAGPAYLYAREALEIMGLSDSIGLLKIGTTWPLPKHLVLSYLVKAKDILIAEDIDPILERNIKTLAAEAGSEIGVKRFFGKNSGHLPAVGELNPDHLVRCLSKLTGRPYEHPATLHQQKAQEIVESLAPNREFGFCPGCPHRASFWAIKNALAEDDREGFVAGDIGCYSMAVWPTGFHQLKTLHAMGSGIGLAGGFGSLAAQGFDQPVISVVGDSTFFHAAIPGLINAACRKSFFVLIVLDNDATAMTGFQPHPGTGRSASGAPLPAIDIENICKSLGVNVDVVDPYNLVEAQQVITRALEDLNAVRVIIMRRTCALVQNRQGGFPYRMHIDPDRCRGESCGCNRFCNRVFRCPGIAWDQKTGQARIDDVTCVGCGVCEQICPAGAIIKESAS